MASIPPRRTSQSGKADVTILAGIAFWKTRIVNFRREQQIKNIISKLGPLRRRQGDSSRVCAEPHRKIGERSLRSKARAVGARRLAAPARTVFSRPSRARTPPDTRQRPRASPRSTRPPSSPPSASSRTRTATSDIRDMLRIPGGKSVSSYLLLRP